MASYILRRFIGALVVLFGISVITFIIAYAAPGDPARLIVGAKAPQTVVDAVRHNLGLDQPLPIQYIHYIGRLLHGDLGFSYHNNLPVAELIGQRIGNTVQLALASWIVEVILGLPLGIFGALYHRRTADYILSFLTLVGMSMPVFWFGMWLIQNVAYGLGILPLGGVGGISHLILPAITLGVTNMAFYQRLVKSSMVDVMSQDYIRTARANGVPAHRVVTRHALKNGLIPAVTYAGMDIAQLCGGVVLTETVFNYQGSASWPGSPLRTWTSR
ncbi:glutathione ABC transporter permease [Alicyclobacillus contaminans]|nr:glutathione ABC transporter permease [Alicyclobacillus contaminans]